MGAASLQAASDRRADRRLQMASKPTLPRCHSFRMRVLFTARQGGGAPLLRAASCWLGVPSAAGVQLVHAEPLATWPVTAAARAPVGQNDLPRLSGTTPGWQLEPPLGDIG